MNIPDRPFHFTSRDEWRVWLEENHKPQKEAWVEIKKHHVARSGIFYQDAVEEALCFGWIDGVMRSAGAEIYFLRFSPRRRGSVWSVSNQERVARLVAQGRMKRGWRKSRRLWKMGNGVQP